MSAPFKRNHTIFCGADFQFEFIWQVGETQEAAAPVDLTGATARLHARADISSADTLMSLTTEDGGITLNEEPGQVRLFVPASTTTSFTWELAVYDLEIVFATGAVRRLMAGTFKTSPEVTR